MFVRGLRLLDVYEWFAYCRGDLRGLFGAKPDDIPVKPAVVYRDEDWRGMRDWLGPPALAPVESEFIGFKRARTFARSLELTSAEQWMAWRRGRLPDRPRPPTNVPDDPARIYPRAWRGWGDWLGTTRRRSASKCPFTIEAARSIVRPLGFSRGADFRAWARGARPDLPLCPENFPRRPETTYRGDGWTTWGEFLGHGRVCNRMKRYRPLTEARAFARALGLRSSLEWTAYAQGGRHDLGVPPVDVPANPHKVYRRDGWTDWGDFLGTGNMAPWLHRWRDFESAKRFARTLRLNSSIEWLDWVAGRLAQRPARPDDVPVKPEVVYEEQGWNGWPDFLGTRGFRRRHMPFAQARALARSLRFRSGAQWKEWLRLERADLPRPPENVPLRPDAVYGGVGWLGWGDFLGTGSK
jgi:hypothetical protein